MENMNKNIKCYDLFAFYGMHSGFNIGMLNLINEVYYSEFNSIEFYSEGVLNKIVKNELNKGNISYYELPKLNNPVIGGYNTLLRDLKACLYVPKIFKSNATDVYIFLAYPFTTLLIHLFSFFSKKKIYLVLHGEMEVFVKNSTFTRNKKYYSLTRFIYKKSKINFILLGETIYNSLDFLFLKKPIVLNLPKKMEDPVLFESKTINRLSIIMIGVADKNKGTESFIQIANEFSKEVEEGILSFEIVGKISEDMKVLCGNNVIYHSELIPYELYNEKIRKSDLALLLKDNTVKATASGTFLDAISYGVPFFSIKNDYIEYYCTNYLKDNCIFDTVSDMVKKINDLLIMNKNDRKDFLIHCQNDILELRTKFTVSANRQFINI